MSRRAGSPVSFRQDAADVHQGKIAEIYDFRASVFDEVLHLIEIRMGRKVAVEDDDASGLWFAAGVGCGAVFEGQMSGTAADETVVEARQQDVSPFDEEHLRVGAFQRVGDAFVGSYEGRIVNRQAAAAGVALRDGDGVQLSGGESLRVPFLRRFQQCPVGVLEIVDKIFPCTDSVIDDISRVIFSQL